jgi:hypothetical protein
MRYWIRHVRVSPLTIALVCVGSLMANQLLRQP